jgi:hypothetical protein
LYSKIKINSASYLPAVNKALSQFGLTVIFSTLFPYQSFVTGLTDPNAPAHFATLLVRKLALVIKRKFRSFNKHQYQADTAANSQTAAMLPLCENFRYLTLKK